MKNYLLLLGIFFILFSFNFILANEGIPELPPAPSLNTGKAVNESFFSLGNFSAYLIILVLILVAVLIYFIFKPKDKRKSKK